MTLINVTHTPRRLWPKKGKYIIRLTEAGWIWEERKPEPEPVKLVIPIEDPPYDPYGGSPVKTRR